ncbi:MAG TPA: TRAP transporter substrate-binding protein [Burkholderiaceae bacterium]|nr:TRAP transporter substrate-binding protein [Burkholderiaceae bacterium]
MLIRPSPSNDTAVSPGKLPLRCTYAALRRRAANCLAGVALSTLVLHPAGAAATQASKATEPIKLRIVGGLGSLNQYVRYEEPFWNKEFAALTQGQASATVVAYDKAGMRTHEVLRLMQLGVVPFGTALMSGIVTHDPELAALDLAGLNPDMASLRRTVAAFRPHLERVMRERHGVEVLALYVYPAQVTFCTRPFKGLSDLAGRRVRISNPTQADLIRPFGAVPVQTEFAEMLPSLRAGNVDCAITGAMSGNTIGLHEVATHLHSGATTWGLSVFGANLAAWHALPESVRTVIKTHLPKVEQSIWADSEKQTLEGVACNTGKGECVLGKPGRMTEVKATAEDVLRLRDAFKNSVLPAWIARCGNACVPTWNDLLAPVVGVRAETLPSKR